VLGLSRWWRTNRESPQKHVWLDDIILLNADRNAVKRGTSRSKLVMWCWQGRIIQEGVDGLPRDKICQSASACPRCSQIWQAHGLQPHPLCWFKPSRRFKLSKEPNPGARSHPTRASGQDKGAPTMIHDDKRHGRTTLFATTLHNHRTQSGRPLHASPPAARGSSTSSTPQRPPGKSFMSSTTTMLPPDRVISPPSSLG
jgi:hypothetical protein